MLAFGRPDRRTVQSVLGVVVALAVVAGAGSSLLGSVHHGNASRMHATAERASGGSLGREAPPINGNLRTSTPAAPSPGWTNLSGPASPPPTEPSRFSMAFDTAAGGVVLFTKNWTWNFHAGVWTNVSVTAGTAPISRWGMTLVDDAADGYVLAFGGNGSCGGYCYDSWAYSGGGWTEIAPSGAPCSQFCPATYDAATGAVLVSTGLGTWFYRNGSWSGTPSPSCGSSCSLSLAEPGVTGTVAYDVADGYTLFYGYGTTWEFHGGAWTNLSSLLPLSPSLRFGEMAYDASVGGVLLGGTDGSGATETWLYHNNSWENRTAPPSPHALDGPMTWDGSDGIVLWFGAEGGAPNDTWCWGTAPPIAQLTIQATPATPAPGELVSFSASFRGSSGSDAYSWQFGDGNSSGLATPGHVYPTGGTYRVTLRLNDSAGHNATAELSLEVYQPLTVGTPQASPDPTTLGTPVTFVAQAIGGTPPFRYAWSFGDGQTGGNLSTIVHTYTTDGPFVANVTVQDARGATAEGSVNVSVALAAVAAASAPSGGGPAQFAFTGAGEGGYPPYGYSWDFGDGTPNATAENPSHTYNASGSYLVTLTVTDTRHTRAVSTVTVTVSPGASVAPWWTGSQLAFLLVGGGLAAVSTGWVVDRLRYRARRREGRRWIDEITEGEVTDPGERPP